MTSGSMSGCDFLAIPQVQHSEDSGVWRYVMEAGFGAEGILDISCLQVLLKIMFCLKMKEVECLFQF